MRPATAALKHGASPPAVRMATFLGRIVWAAQHLVAFPRKLAARHAQRSARNKWWPWRSRSERMPENHLIPFLRRDRPGIEGSIFQPSRGAKIFPFVG